MGYPPVITNAKTKDRETIYFTDESLSWLKRYLDMRNDRSPYLFVTYNGKQVNPASIRHELHIATKDLGLNKRVHPHLFRCTFGTELLQGGVDIKSVQTLMRHKSERTTLKHYIAVNKDRCKGEHQRILNGTQFLNPAFLTVNLSQAKEAQSL